MILFLDCDGVINSADTDWMGQPHAPYAFDPELVARLRALIELLGLMVVVSSTWRILLEREQFIEIIGEWIRPYLHPLWRTSRTYNRMRGTQILDWFERADLQTTTPHVIVDDDRDFWWWQPHVHIDHQYGLTDADCRSVEMTLLAQCG